MSSTSSVNKNPTAAITNNLGYDVDIYDVFNHNTNQELLTYTKLATVPNGASKQQVQTIHPSSQLQAMRTGNIAAFNNDYFQQFPVAVIVTTPFVKNASYTLTPAMQQAMEQTFKFLKYAEANPDATMAEDLRKALADKDQTTAVNKFLAGTSTFQQATMSTYTAVMSWQSQFTSPWQGTYYLYSVPSSTGTTSTNPALIATLDITSSAQANSATLTMAGTGGQSATLVMVGDGTMQEQDAGIGNLSVRLRPVWMNINQTTTQTSAIGVAFTGTVNGTQVSGNLNRLKIPDPSDDSDSAAGHDAVNSDMLSKVESLVGMLAGFVMIFDFAKKIKEELTQKRMMWTRMLRTRKSLTLKRTLLTSHTKQGFPS